MNPVSEGIVWNVPNQLSAARIVLAAICFLAICMGWYLAALVLFLLAAITDFFDGYLARKWNQITQLGRILDPFADKVIICGSFILLGSIEGSFIPAWVAVIVTARELLVTALRGLVEGHNMDFSAVWAGKVKMVVQTAAVAMSLYRLHMWTTWYDSWPVYDNLLVLMVIAATVSTLHSGWGYLKLAARMLGPAAPSGEHP